tara:strand:- start:101358 stop:101900 length:543 start_codon:yes stop_codon:yes gene_type:complete
MAAARITHPAALWGIFGFVLILCQAVVRLAPLAWQPIGDGTLEPLHWALYGGSILFNGYFEGYKAFQLQVAPRVVARASHLASHPKLLHVIFAPLFCMTLFHATRKRLVISWLVYAGIITIVVAVRQLSQPWRGIVDAGVVVGLSWGIIAIVAMFVRVARGAALTSSAELPELHSADRGD